MRTNQKYAYIHASFSMNFSYLYIFNFIRRDQNDTSKTMIKRKKQHKSE